jgi:hypothetical protein
MLDLQWALIAIATLAGAAGLPDLPDDHLDPTNNDAVLRWLNTNDLEIPPVDNPLVPPTLGQERP